jgi:asparagine synthase (glutamine-hydrolysing)
LRSILSSAGRNVGAGTDAELILLAYEQWGTAAADRLIGEFAFALWDEKERILFCGRDALGVRPFYYFFDLKTFIFASELQQLVKHRDVRVRPNDAVIGEYLAKNYVTRAETLYRDIQRLPGGHYLTVSPSGLAVKRYWNLRPDRLLHKNDAEYAEEFLDVFSEAVRCRIADSCKIGFDLSGGLDSSSILCLANRLEPNAPRHEAFSLACVDPRADERSFISAVSRKTGVKTHMLPTTRVDHSRIQQLVEIYKEPPGPANLLMHDLVLQTFQEKGFRVRLTGSGGDQLTIGDPRHTADLLKSLKVWSAVRQASLDAKVLNDWGDQISPQRVLFQFGILPLLPRTVRRFGKRLLRYPDLPIWIEPEFAQKIALVDRILAFANSAEWKRFPTMVQNEIWKIENHAWWGVQLEWWDRYNFSFGIEVRHPFYDRRLVEFCVRSPEEQRWRGNETRFALRSVMKGLLPEEVRNRRTKGDFTEELIRHLLQPEVKATLHSSLLAQQGYINSSAVSEMYSDFEGESKRGIRFPRFESPLTLIYGLEFWFRTVFT